MTEIHCILLGAVVLLAVILVCWHYRHQRILKSRAYLMREAIRCKDFSFRLPTRGLFFGERALQSALNDFSRNINSLMAQREVETWQRLTRVLTHEIMNAATPISSITQTYLSDPNIKGSPYEEGIEAIYQTSVGMTQFVQNFRKITCIQEAKVAEVDLTKLLQSLRNLYPHLAWQIDLPDDFTLLADEGMLRQVLINLIKNAIEAGAKKIDVRLFSDSKEKEREPHQQLTLLVSNDGAPIAPDVAREIFTPFFTTKKEGSGIGLTLSRQMMMKQGMNLLLAEHSQPGYHVTFQIDRVQRLD